MRMEAHPTKQTCKRCTCQHEHKRLQAPCKSGCTGCRHEGPCDWNTLIWRPLCLTLSPKPDLAIWMHFYVHTHIMKQHTTGAQKLLSQHNQNTGSHHAQLCMQTSRNSTMNARVAQPTHTTGSKVHDSQSITDTFPPCP